MKSHIIAIDDILNQGRWVPRWGWHDDHRQLDGTTDYLPALQQVRSEFFDLVEVLDRANVIGGRCLQLGIGECEASHAMWRLLFRDVVTIDWSVLAHQDERVVPGADTHSHPAAAFAASHGHYDFLFIDAGHSFEDARLDHRDYGPMVRKGGIIAFHDSLQRKGYEEVEVWRYLETLGGRVNPIGSEVGTAWIVQE